ncbi:MAG: ArdC family protein [Candidatus Tyrphobacter sp.]
MSSTAEKAKLTPAERAEEHAQKIASLLIDQLQKGTSPWQRPWELSKNDGMPVNATTGKRYNGSNMLYLWALGIERGYTDNRWLTYKQGEANNVQVRKGEKGVGICFPATHYEVQKKDSSGKPIFGADGQPEKVFIKYDQPRMRYYTVFHASQVDGLPPIEKPRELPEWERHERAEAILKASKAVIHHGGNRAYYMPGLDFIQLPYREQFASQDAYYGTSLHELGHWTGHADRLNRDGITGGHAFGSEGYAKEELIAETASLMLSMELQIPNDFQQHASYVDHWVKILQDEPAAILKACSAASKVQDYVLAFDKSLEHEHDLEHEAKVEQTLQPAKVKSWEVGVLDSACIANLDNGIFVSTHGDEYPGIAVQRGNERIWVRYGGRGPGWDALTQAFHDGTPYTEHVDCYISKGDHQRLIPTEVKVERSGDDVLVSLRPMTLDSPSQGFDVTLTGDDAHRLANGMELLSEHRVEYTETLEGLRAENEPSASLEQARQIIAGLGSVNSANTMGRSR